MVGPWPMVGCGPLPLESGRQAHPPEGFFNYLCGGSDEKPPSRRHRHKASRRHAASGSG